MRIIKFFVYTKNLISLQKIRMSHYTDLFNSTKIDNVETLNAESGTINELSCESFSAS